MLRAIDGVNANLASTQTAVQNVGSAVTDAHQGIESHLTRQDSVLNQISSKVDAIYSLVKHLVKPWLMPLPMPVDTISVAPKPVTVLQQQVSPRS